MAHDQRNTMISILRLAHKTNTSNAVNKIVRDKNTLKSKWRVLQNIDMY